MTDTKPPGQCAYEACAAFWRGYGFGRQTHLPWPSLTPEQRGAWDAAAQAVLDACQAQVDLVVQAQKSPHRWTPQPLHATGEDTPQEEAP